MPKRLESLFEDHKLVRRLLIVWAAVLITWVTVRVFTDLSAITTAAVSAFGLVVGILATVIGHYQWARQRDDQSK